MSAGQLVPGPSPSPRARDASERAQELVASQLADVRNAAESWRTGLLAVLGLTTTILVVKGRDSFKDLDLVPQALIGLALLLALIFAAVGSWQSMRAAYGDPKPRTTAGILTWDYQDSAAAVSSLKWARRLLFGSLFWIVVAVALTWYWPVSANTKIRADFGADTVCGTLQRADGQTIVIKEDGSEKSNPTSQLTSLAVVTACP